MKADPNLDERELKRLEELSRGATRAPWQSFIEGRDHVAGSDFIRTGGLDNDSPDIELIGASKADQDFIAAARQAVPMLIQEVRRRRNLLAKNSDDA